jgi:hypothetical protein
MPRYFQLPVITISFAGLIWGCSTTKQPEPLQPIDTKLEQKAATPNETVGLNKDGEAIVQKEDSASAALVTLEHVNENIKLDLKQQFFMLRECRETIALSQYGGSGEYPELTDFDALEAQYEKQSKLGIEDGKIKVVETSDLKNRITAQRDFQKELNSFIRTVKKEYEKCNFRLKEASTAK